MLSLLTFASHFREQVDNGFSHLFSQQARFHHQHRLSPTAVLFLGEQASEAAAATFSEGYKTAMFLAAGLLVAGALVSLVKGQRQTQAEAQGRRPSSPDIPSATVKEPA